MTLSAPSDPANPLAGVLFYQDRDVIGNYTHIFNGGAEMNLDGMIYAAGAEVQYNGGSDSSLSQVMIVADTVDIGGLADFDALAGSTILQNSIFAGAKLVE